MKLKYQPGDRINNKASLLLQVQESNLAPCGKNGRKVTKYHVTCEKCGHVFTPTIAGAFEKRKSCPGCEKKPAALKTDDTGNCITICRMGQLEYIHNLITEENMTQQGAVESFIEAVQAHASEGDPLTSELTVEMVRSQYRRDSGKLTEKPRKTLVEPTKDKKAERLNNQQGGHPKQETEYKCLPTVAGVQAFLNEYLPGYKIVIAGGEARND